MSKWISRFYAGLYDWLIRRCYAGHVDDIGEAPPGYGPDAYRHKA